MFTGQYGVAKLTALELRTQLPLFHGAPVPSPAPRCPEPIWQLMAVWLLMWWLMAVWLFMCWSVLVAVCGGYVTDT